MITFLSGPGGDVDPGYGVPGFSGGHPGNALPGGGYPSHGLPGGGHITTLPVFPFDPTDPGYDKPSGSRPDNSLPGEGGRPDNSLPGGGHISTMPIVPGRRFIVKWLACYGLILVPDNSLPETPEPK